MKLSRRNLSFFVPAIIVLVTVAAYLNGINGDFVFDDIPLVSSDSFYSSESTTFADCWKRAYWRDGMSIGQYRPLTVASFWLNAKLTGMDSPKFRIFNLMLHVVISLLVFKLGMRLRLGKLTAFLSALVFAVMPLHSEAVIPTSGRAELLCAIFIIAGLICYIKYGFSGAKALLTPFFLMLACWSKENGIVLLPLCLLYDIIYRQILLFPEGKKSLFLKIRQVSIAYGGFAIALVLLILSRIAGVGTLLPTLNKNLWVDNPLLLLGIGARAVVAMQIQGMVIAKYFWPSLLSHDYSYAQILPVANFADLHFLLAVAVLIVLPALLCILLPQRRKLILFLIFAYILSILPAGNFITPTGTIFGERLYYFPSVWFCFAAVFLFVRIARKRRLLFAVALPVFMVVLIASCWRIWVRAEDWKDSMTISMKGVDTAPQSVKTWNNLAVQFACIGEFDQAVAACDITLKIHPEYSQTMINRANYYLELRNMDAAEKDFRKLIQMGSKDADVHNKLGALLANKGKNDEAEFLWRKSLKLKPDQPEIKKALKVLYRKR